MFSKHSSMGHHVLCVVTVTIKWSAL